MILIVRYDGSGKEVDSRTVSDGPIESDAFFSWPVLTRCGFTLVGCHPGGKIELSAI